MDKDFIRSDSDLMPVLSTASDQDLALLVVALRRARSCSLDEACRDPFAITDELQRLGGFSGLNSLRGHGVLYREIVVDVGKELDLDFSADKSISDREFEITKAVIERRRAQLSEESRTFFEHNLRQVLDIPTGVDLAEGISSQPQGNRPRMISIALNEIAAGMAMPWNALGPSFYSTIPAVLAVAKMRIFCGQDMTSPENTLPSSQPEGLDPHGVERPVDACSAASEDDGPITNPHPDFDLTKVRAFYISGGSECVEAWSVFPIPYNPPIDSAPWHFKMALQEKLDWLSANLRDSKRGCQAVYSSPFREVAKADTENVLFYNVDRFLTVRRGLPFLRFERICSLFEPCPVELCTQPICHYKYTLVPLSEVAKDPPASCFTVETKFDPEKCDRQDIWLAVSRKLDSGAGLLNVGALEGRSYGLRVTLWVPEAIYKRRAFVMKKIFDGVLSALHQFPAGKLGEVPKRLCQLLGIRPEEADSLLCRPNGKVLGYHQALVVRGDSLMFNPRDDTCDAGELVLTISNSENVSAIRAEIFPL